MWGLLQGQFMRLFLYILSCVHYFFLITSCRLFSLLSLPPNTVMGWVGFPQFLFLLKQKIERQRQNSEAERKFYLNTLPREEWARVKVDKGPCCLDGRPFYYILARRHLFDKVRSSDWLVHLYSHPSQWACPFPECTAHRKEKWGR